MTREELIRKWMDDELDAQELKAFQALDDYDELLKLSEALKAFSAPKFNSTEALNTVLTRINSEENVRRSSWKTTFLRIAAVVVIGLGLSYFVLNNSNDISTEIAQKTSLELPDESLVELNALSTISFNERNWNDSREVNLDGEAYFKVSRGQKFSVITSEGIVSVLGTEFNVKNRDGLFHVICYEGSVKVEHPQQSSILKAGDQFLIVDGKYIATEKETTSKPVWIENKSSFKSLPYSMVLEEFQRQYDVEIKTEKVDLDTLFSGSFTHTDLPLALKSITLPLNLEYQQTQDGTIVLKGE